MIDINLARTKCAVCGRTFEFLGAHLARKHQISARQYKMDNGLDLTLTLASDEVKQKWADGVKGRLEDIKAMFRKKGRKFQAGHPGRAYTSDQMRERSRATGLANAGRPMPDRTRMAIRAAWSGRKHKPETIAKMSRAKSRYWERIKDRKP